MTLNELCTGPQSVVIAAMVVERRSASDCELEGGASSAGPLADEELGPSPVSKLSTSSTKWHTAHALRRLLAGVTWLGIEGISVAAWSK